MLWWLLLWWVLGNLSWRLRGSLVSLVGLVGLVSLLLLLLDRLLGLLSLLRMLSLLLLLLLLMLLRWCLSRWRRRGRRHGRGIVLVRGGSHSCQEIFLVAVRFLGGSGTKTSQEIQRHSERCLSQSK